MVSYVLTCLIMWLSLLKSDIHISRRTFLVNAVFFFSFFESYFIFTYYLIAHTVPTIDDRLPIQAAFHLVIVVALFLSGRLIHRFNELRVIYACAIVNVVLSIFLVVPIDFFRIGVLFVMEVVGSIGILAAVTYFWRLTGNQERGRIAGLIGFFVIPSYFIVNIVVAPGLDFLGTIILSIIVSILPLACILLKPSQIRSSKNRDGHSVYYEKRVTVLYLIPWIVFSIINFTLAKNESNIIQAQVLPSFYLTLLASQLIGVIFGVSIGGVMSDLLGRRLPLVFSLTLYGFSSALLGLFTNDVLVLIVYVANGLSWGFLFVLYIFVIWGDLANKNNYTRVYSLGLMTYYLSMGIGLLVQVDLPIFQSALLSCLLVFLLNIPVVLAPELLPTYILDRLRMKAHMGAVKKLQRDNQG